MKPLPDLDETWRPIPGYEGRYSVSDAGRVFSHERIVMQTWRGRKCPRLRRGLLLKTGISSHGYPVAGLSTDGVMRHFTTARLVLLAFVGPMPDGMEACHNDGVRANSALTNLRYDTRARNVLDRVKHRAGDPHPTAKLDAHAVLRIRSDSRPRPVIAAEYGISLSHVFKICAGMAWRSL